MSSTIGDLVDRVYREYLEPAESLESYSFLTGGIDSSANVVALEVLTQVQQH